MDLRVLPGPGSGDDVEPRAQAVLPEVACRWTNEANAPEELTAVVVHAAHDMLVLEACGPPRALPPLGTAMQLSGDIGQLTGRLAEQGRGGRFLVSVGDRPVRRDQRLRVSVPGTLRSATLGAPITVEIVDLTTSGARIRGVELAAGTQVTFEFTPPGRDAPVTVRGLVAHSSAQTEHSWIGVVFRLVAMRGGR